MIYIEEGDGVPLPKQFHYQHNVCVKLYDLLVDILNQPHYKGLLSSHVSFDGESKQLIESIKSGELHILDYLEEKGKKSDIIEVLTKHIYGVMIFLLLVIEDIILLTIQ